MFELTNLLENPAQLAAVVAAITAWLKARLNLNGNRTVLVSFLVSAVLVLGALLSRLYPDLVNTLIVLIIGAVGAGGTVDLVKGITGQKQ